MSFYILYEGWYVKVLTPKRSDKVWSGISLLCPVYSLNALRWTQTRCRRFSNPWFVTHHSKMVAGTVWPSRRPWAPCGAHGLHHSHHLYLSCFDAIRTISCSKSSAAMFAGLSPQCQVNHYCKAFLNPTHYSDGTHGRRGRRPWAPSTILGCKRRMVPVTDVFWYEQ